ncbi:MAG: SseB family protein [Gammaproteobacteria bacterium]
MTELDQVIAAAYASQGQQEDVNKVYLTLLRNILFLPISKEKEPGDEEPFRPLFAQVDDNYFMLAFDTLERLKTWADDQLDNIDYVEISGAEIIAGVSDSVYLCLNYGTEFYKEFSPDEVKRLKMIVARIEQMKGGEPAGG